MTLYQTPIKGAEDVASIGLGSKLTMNLGLGGSVEFETNIEAQENAEIEQLNSVNDSNKVGSEKPK
jgi:hypothetical protein